MNRPKHAGLRHLALNTRNLEAMRHFYVDLLGFTIEWQPDPDNVYLTSGVDNLALHRVDGLPPPGEMGALDHLGFVVPTYEDVDAWYARVLAAGFRADTEPRTHRDGARSFYMRDPEQNRIQIIHHPPISGS